MTDFATSCILINFNIPSSIKRSPSNDLVLQCDIFKMYNRDIPNDKTIRDREERTMHKLHFFFLQ